jgi:spore germination protein PD
MDFSVINGELSVCEINVTYLSTAATLMIGDIRSVALYSAFEGPPENVIVGVTPGLIAPELPTVG